MTWKLIETCIAAIKTTFSNIENIERDEDWFVDNGMGNIVLVVSRVDSQE